MTLTAVQADLLRAAFATGDASVEGWQRWRDAVDWDAHLPHDEFRLLPRIARNLVREGVVDPLLSRLQGISRQAWYANQTRLRNVTPTLQALAASGVELLIRPPTTVVADDATSVLSPHVPLACAVRGAHAEAAIHGLERAGWRTERRLPRWSLGGYLLVAESLTWRGVDGQRLDLSWQWDASDRSGRLCAEVWERARPGRLANTTVRVMDPADAVYDLCRQPATGDGFASLVDLLMTLVPTAPDWTLVLARGRIAPVEPAWTRIVREAHTLFPDLVPRAVVADWPAWTASPAPVASSSPRTMRERVAAHWSKYRRAWGEQYSFARALRHLPGYLLALWGLPSPRRLPIRAWRGLRFEWRETHRQR